VKGLHINTEGPLIERKVHFKRILPKTMSKSLSTLSAV